MDVTESATLLYFLVGNNCLELAKALLSRPAKASASETAASENAQASNVVFDINAKCSNQYGSVLALGAAYGGADIVRLLLDHGAEIDNPSRTSHQTLKGAASANDIDTVRLLLQHGAEVNAQEPPRESTLSAAAHDGSHELVSTLLDYGADANVGDMWGGPLRAAIAGSLLYWGKDENPYYRTVNLLLAHGAQVSVWSDTQESPLRLAASRFDKCMMKLLLRHGAEMDTNHAAKQTGLSTSKCILQSNGRCFH